MSDNDLKVDFEDVKTSAKNMIKMQMAQFGQLNPSEKELDDIAARVLGNQEEVRRISEQVVSQKLLDLYKEKANIKTKEMSYEAFVKEVYGDK
jgi:trigger factor